MIHQVFFQRILRVLSILFVFFGIFTLGAIFVLDVFFALCVLFIFGILRGKRLQRLYAILAGMLSVWVVSFVPAEGPSLMAYIPDTASVIFHARSGSQLFKIAQDNAALQELHHDPDITDLFQLDDQYQKALKQYERVPALARWLFPATIDGLYPLLGRDAALVWLEADDVKTTDEFAEKSDSSKSKPSVLLLTRLSGGRGALIRMAGAFAKLPKNIHFFDLGGGLVALSLNGAAPASGDGKLQPTRMPADADTAGLHIARLIIRPDKLISPASPLNKSSAIAQTAQFLDLLDGMPRLALEALLKPPTAIDLLNFDQPPRKIQVELLATNDGGLKGWGCLSGAIPPLPLASNSSNQTNPAAFAEALLPMNVRAAFLWYLEQDLRIKKNAAAGNMTKMQKRWRYRFTQMQLNDVDLDRDLWPAFGQILYMDVCETPEELSASRYGQINATIAFDGARQGAREAAKNLSLLWNYCYDKSDKQKTQFVTREAFDGYVLGWKISMLGWIFSNQKFFFTTDAGLLARTSPDRAVETLYQNSRRASNASSCYFLRLDGPHMAPTVEMLMERHYGNIEDDMGSQQFFEHYADAPLRIRVAKKISKLVGQLALEVKPTSVTAADISISWTPGALKTEEKPQTEDVAPPPALY
ncbi:MAG: hypothetical protein V1899_03825 [Planctomycetota bacterium]